MKLLVIAMLVVGVTMVLNGYYRANLTTPPPHIIYRFLPRSLEEDSSNPAKVSDIFAKMFSDSNPDVYSSG